MDEKTADLRVNRLEPKRVEGGNLPAVVHDLDQPLNQEDECAAEPTPDKMDNQRRSGS